MNTKSILSTTAALVLLPLVGVHAGPPSVEVPPTASEDSWWVRSTSYGWLTAQEGSLRVGKLLMPLNIGFSDAVSSVDELDMAFMGGLEAGKGKWSLGVDLTYAKASDDSAGGGTIFKSFGVEQTSWMINPYVTYQLLKESRWQLDGIVGARINIFEMDITGRFAKGGQITVGGSRDWIDPIVGLRGRVDLSDRLSVGFRGDIGGFGVASDLTWQAYVGLGWKLTSKTTFALGYRGLGTDYSRGGFGSDITSHGPLIGIQMAF